MSSTRFQHWLAFSLLALLPTVARAATPAQVCESRSAAALSSCANAVSRQELKCVQTTGAACLSGDTKVAAALASVSTKVLKACPDAATLTAAGYGAALTPAGFVAQLQGACQDAPASLFARSFGGPHAAVRATASATDKQCLDRAYNTGRTQIDYAFKQQSSCLIAAHAGRSCDPATVSSRISAREAKNAASIA